MNLRYPFKIFVRETGENIASPKKDAFSEHSPSLSGDQAKLFYDEVIGTIPTTVPKSEVNHTHVVKNYPSPVKPKLPGNIFYYAQNNDLYNLKAAIESGIDINYKDEFGWTPLMCAACYGCQSVVIYLLQKGADITVQDKAGYNAESLAKRNRHHKIAYIITHNNVFKNRKQNIKQKKIEQFCSVCQETFRDNVLRHETSTVHLLKRNCNCQNKTYYGIPESNKGFQLLIQNGWNREKGLGPEGSGRKFPIKVTQKSDRTGIGAQVVKRKLLPNQPSQPNRKSKREEKILERNYRMEFS